MPLNIYFFFGGGGGGGGFGGRHALGITCPYTSNLLRYF
jgi:hypothetical protein